MIEAPAPVRNLPLSTHGLAEATEIAFYQALKTFDNIQKVKCVSVLSLYHLPERPAATAEDGRLFVILGCGLLLLYMPEPGEAGIRDVLAYLVEGHDESLWRDLKNHFQNEPQALTFSPLYLDMLSPMAQALMPGWVVTLDVAKQEVLKRKALRHPSIDREGGEPVSHQGHVVFRPLRPHKVNRFLREGLPEQIEGLADPFCGVVKEEATYFNPVGMLQHITRIRKGGATTGGRSLYRTRARTLSYCEAVERFQTDWGHPERVIRATYRELGKKALDPLRFFCHTPSAPTESDQNDPELCLDWVWADNLSKRKRVLIPVSESFNFEPSDEGLPSISCTTNGVALGGSYEEALLYGIFEFIERDSFLTAWRLRRCCKRLDHHSLKDLEFQVLLAAMAFRHPQYSLHFFDTSTDTCLPSVWVVAVRRKSGVGMKTLSAASCRLTYRAAMMNALSELAGLMSFNLGYEEKRAHYRRYLKEPEMIISIEDHLSYYGLDESFEHFSFLNFENSVVPVIEPRFDFFPSGQNLYDFKEIIEGILEILAARGMEVVARDLTCAEFERRKLFCVRATITDLLPLSFGPALTRFQITTRLRALARQWGIGELTMERINQKLHPMG